MNFIVAKFLATCFFVGNIKKAPGTFGTLAGMVLIYPFFQLFSFYDLQYLISGTFVLGLIATRIYTAKIKIADPKEVVIDEVVGVWICLFMIKYYIPNFNQELVFSLSFVFFRFFDIVKPFPISYFDKTLKNPFGVMFDDVLAGIFAGISIIILLKIYDRFY
jgi:phosphatidylglycerophosphatase A